MRLRIGLLALVGYMGVSVWHLPVWQSDVSLWSDAVTVTPTLPRPAVNLAGAYLREQRWREAETAWQRAEQLSWSDGKAQAVLASQRLWLSALQPLSSASTESP